MDLLSNLNAEKWTNAEPSSVQGFKEYTIIKSKALPDGLTFEMAIQELVEDGMISSVHLEFVGSKNRNPLQSLRNAEFKVVDHKIVAINLDGDCVVRK